MNKTNPHRSLFLKGIVLIIMVCVSLVGFAQKPKEVRIKQADDLLFDRQQIGNVQRLVGNVILEHEGALLSCDSAWLYSGANRFQAFGHVVINHNDTLTISGDSLLYEGNTRTANLYHNIRLQTPSSSLTTNRMIYHTDSKQALYTGGGEIIDKDNRLRSRSGTYDANSSTYFFKDSVKLFSKQYEISTDTLKYNTITHRSTFLGPTYIEGEGNTVYCENGWYNTRTDQLEYNTNVSIASGNQRLKGDSIVFDKNTGIGKIFRQVEILDTAQHTLVRGDYAEYMQKMDSSFVTGHVLLIMVMDSDSLYLHADTLRTREDSVSHNKTLYAYNKVRFYKSDMQGQCDSLIYREADSTITMYGKPVLWSEENQMTSGIIRLRLWDGKVQKLLMNEEAMIISQEDSSRFNQIKGRDMTGFFNKNRLHKINVVGNGQTIYFAKNDKEEMIGVNKAECSDMMIFMKENKVKSITFITQPDATLFPINDIPPSELRLKKFRWMENVRPANQNDIFQWPATL
ncbi:MAG: hypothetical protein KDD36_05525 [Flavobacteriales bacterium]|nr:hypothetical protein [Flavobacteriales bacterium]